MNASQDRVIDWNKGTINARREYLPTQLTIQRWNIVGYLLPVIRRRKSSTKTLRNCVFIITSLMLYRYLFWEAIAGNGYKYKGKTQTSFCYLKFKGEVQSTGKVKFHRHLNCYVYLWMGGTILLYVYGVCSCTPFH